MVGNFGRPSGNHGLANRQAQAVDIGGGSLFPNFRVAGGHIIPQAFIDPARPGSAYRSLFIGKADGGSLITCSHNGEFRSRGFFEVERHYDAFLNGWADTDGAVAAHDNGAGIAQFFGKGDGLLFGPDK